MPFTALPSAFFDARCWLTLEFSCEGAHVIRAAWRSSARLRQLQRFVRPRVAGSARLVIP
jgi:hypothetical protein